MKMKISKYVYLLYLLISSLIVFSQSEVLTNLQINPVVFSKWKESVSVNAKMTSIVDTLSLPFLDDFSKENVYPSDLFWMDKSVFINRDYAVAPVTIGVATFDGIDSTGYPYNFSASSGSSEVADHLTSKPIDLSIPSSDTVYLSFYYQARGRGDAPETKDSLILELMSPADNHWNMVWYKNGYIPSSTDTSFHLVMIPIKESSYLKKGFQFRFKNYATVSGNVDHWNLDYVYLNKNRRMDDTVFNDVAFVYSASSFLKNYQAMPWHHYFASERADTVINFIRNNFNDTKNIGYHYTVSDGFSVSTPTGGTDNINPFYTNGYSNCGPPDCPLFFHPPITYTFTPNSSDYALFTITHYLKTDTVSELNNDNDTLRFYQKFYNYYAYDDGTAEAGYGLSQPFSQLAYKFTLPVKDTLRALQMYFNPVVNNVSNKPFRIAVWNDNGGLPGNIIFADSITYPEYEPGYNSFHTYSLEDTLLVLNPGTFYVGWIQIGSEVLNIGFDVNNNSQSKIYFNTTGSWNNSIYKGSLMMRPVFGKKDLFAGVEQRNAKQKFKNNCEIYPNPAQDKLFVKIQDNEQNDFSWTIFDSFGKNILTGKNQNLEELNISSLSNGLYLIKIEYNYIREISKKFCVIE